MALSVYARKETARLPVSETKTNRDFQTDKSSPPHKLTAWKKRNSVDFRYSSQTSYWNQEFRRISRVWRAKITICECPAISKKAEATSHTHL